MRIAVIGAGRMGRIRVEDLVADPRVTSVLVANRTDERATDLADRYGATAVAWDRLEDLDVDATVVALATDAHADLLHQVLRGGGPVLCEKPIALRLSDTEAVMDLAERCGASLQVGFQRRFDPGLSAVHDLAGRGELGTLYSLRLIAHDHQPSTPEFIAGSGGIFRDLLVHDLDQIAWLTGEAIATVYASKAVRAHPDYARFDDADVALVHAVTTGGVQASVHASRHDALGHDVRLEAFGSTDSVSAGLGPRTPLRSLDPSDTSTDGEPVAAYAGFVDRFREAFRRETASFVSHAAGELENPCPPQAALDSLRAAIACEISVATRAPVRVSDVVDPHP